MKDFVVRHPETARALQILQGNPFSSGFADASYNGLDAFRFVNAARRIDTGSVVDGSGRLVPTGAGCAQSA
jgi:catalase